MSLAAYVAEDGLLSHHWKERPLVLRRSYAPVQGQEVGVGGLGSRGLGDRGFLERKVGKGIIFEM